MNKGGWISILAVAILLVLLAAPEARAQRRPYLGYAYPAGGQQGTTFMVKAGGQNLTALLGGAVSGKGVKVELIEYHWKLSPQYVSLLREQVRDLKDTLPKPSKKSKAGPKPVTRKMPDIMQDAMANLALASNPRLGSSGPEASLKLIEKIDARVSEWVNRPAVSSIAEIAYLRITVAPGAEPGERDLRLVTPQGVSNPLVFCVGQVPETRRRPMKTASFQVLGKEYLAQRKRPDEEVQMNITLPCTMNGQVASGERNEYRFTAKKGQRLMISSMARKLIPYIADAVPGWFQPVIVVHDSEGNELAYDDDYRFKPDPIMHLVIPKDGDYVLSIYDAIYRGREDFIYRITIGATPFISSIFPLGGRVGAVPKIAMQGWNLKDAKLKPPPANAGEGVYQLAAVRGKLKTNSVPFKLDTLPERFDKEPNNTPKSAQQVQLPLIVNGRIDRTDDWDVFRFQGKAGQTVVAEVQARRLDSPVDSVIRLTDAAGNVLVLNDDKPVMFDEGSKKEAAERLKAAGLYTHDADSYFRFKLPSDGAYYLHMGDTARNGGKEYAYRLRISQPRGDFELRAVPSSVAIRANKTAYIRVYAIRKDGFDGPIKVSFKNLPEGFESRPAYLTSDRMMTGVSLKTKQSGNGLKPIDLYLEGAAKTERGEIVRPVAPAEDRMQAFLWRHLVPTEDGVLKGWFYDPSYKPKPKRIPKYKTKLEDS